MTRNSPTIRGSPASSKSGRSRPSRLDGSSGVPFGVVNTSPRSIGLSGFFERERLDRNSRVGPTLQYALDNRGRQIVSRHDNSHADLEADSIELTQLRAPRRCSGPAHTIVNRPISRNRLSVASANSLHGPLDRISNCVAPDNLSDIQLFPEDLFSAAGRTGVCQCGRRHRPSSCDWLPGRTFRAAVATRRDWPSLACRRLQCLLPPNEACRLRERHPGDGGRPGAVTGRSVASFCSRPSSRSRGTRSIRWRPRG